MAADWDINYDDLDREWIRQPSLYEHWSRMASQAIRKKDDLELERKIKIASLGRSIREEVARKGEKITETALEERIRTSDDYKKISLELNAAVEQVGILEGAKWAMVSKEKSLENLSASRIKERTTKDGYKEQIEQAKDNKQKEYERTSEEISKGIKLRK